jgi:hypothetical protein
MASMETAYLEYEAECGACLRSTELELENLRQTLDRTMSSLACAFQGMAESEGSGGQRLDAAVEAIQFHDIGGQWLVNIASNVRKTQQLVTALRVPFEAMRSAASGDWQGFERGAAHWERISQNLAELKTSRMARPVGHALESFGDVELF